MFRVYGVDGVVIESFIKFNYFVSFNFDIKKKFNMIVLKKIYWNIVYV